MNIFSPAQLALKAHIEAANAKSAAWIAEDAANRFSGMLSTDLNHWADQGIDSIETFEFEMTASAYIEPWDVSWFSTDSTLPEDLNEPLNSKS